jgi:hypothetical protein
MEGGPQRVNFQPERTSTTVLPSVGPARASTIGGRAQQAEPDLTGRRETKHPAMPARRRRRLDWKAVESQDMVDYTRGQIGGRPMR